MMSEAQKNVPDVNSPQRCCVCFKSFSDHTMIYYPSLDLEQALGECCAEVDRENRYFAEELHRCPPLKYDDPAPWEYDDHAWFLLNPDRFHRLRKAYTWEFPELDIGKLDRLIVRRLKEDECLKVLLSCPASALLRQIG